MAAELAFRIVNVFTRGREALSGNPLCVFEDGSGLDTVTMQALALQFNLSETTFILPSTVAAARVRIFTPCYEMPFAGHPTLGTAHVCRSLAPGTHSLELEMQAGIIPVRADGDRWTLTAPTPSWREVEYPRETIAAALGLEPQDIGERPLWVKAGKEQLIVPLNSTEAVRRAAPRSGPFAELRSADGQAMAYVFSSMTATDPARVEPAAADSRAARPTATDRKFADRLLSRFFFPQGAAVLEDPATGSATANLGGWWFASRRPLPAVLHISQGEFTGRPSALQLDVDAEGRIFVGGNVIEVGSGTIRLR